MLKIESIDDKQHVELLEASPTIKDEGSDNNLVKGEPEVESREAPQHVADSKPIVFESNDLLNKLVGYGLPLISCIAHFILFILVVSLSDDGFSGFALFFSLAYCLLALITMIGFYFADARFRCWSLIGFPRPMVCLSMCAVVALYTLFLLRLLSPPSDLPLPRQPIAPFNYSYRGPEFLDFGPKEYNGTDLNGDYSSNISYKINFNSFGHMTWGLSLIIFFINPLLTLLLLPKKPKVENEDQEQQANSDAVITNGILINKITLVTDSIASITTAAYPMYNTIKRISKHGDTFATSSICNNGFEWATGAFFSLSLGFTILVLVGGNKIIMDRFYNAYTSDGINESNQASIFSGRNFKNEFGSGLLKLGKNQGSSQPLWQVIFFSIFHVIGWLIAIILMFVAFLVVGMFTSTWGHYANPARDVTTLTFMWIITFLCLAFWVLYIFKISHWTR